MTRPETTISSADLRTASDPTIRRRPRFGMTRKNCSRAATESLLGPNVGDDLGYVRR